MQEELIDRFGLLPEPVKSLLKPTACGLPPNRWASSKSTHTRSHHFAIRAEPPMRIIELVQKNKHIRLNGQDKLRITASMPDLASRVNQIKQTMKALH
jgi:transcription-repair coupling factor (superfamily II helicase)